MNLSWEMIEAVSANNCQAIASLLAAGQDVNAQNIQGETAFSYACARNAIAAAKLLVDRGADINTIDAGGGSPLDWAVCWVSPEFREWLKSIGGKRHDMSYPDQPWPRDGGPQSDHPP
jgi:hypothetical protein